MNANPIRINRTKIPSPIEGSVIELVMFTAYADPFVTFPPNESDCRYAGVDDALTEFCATIAVMTTATMKNPNMKMATPPRLALELSVHFIIEYSIYSC